MVREFRKDDIDQCVQLLIDTYNREPWNDQWNDITARKYLIEFITHKRSVGFIVSEADKIIGALFAHKRTWCTADEIYIDEIFVDHRLHRKGYGKMLIDHIQEYAKSQKISAITLLTDKRFPAYAFYEKNGFVCSRNTIFMYKECK